MATVAIAVLFLLMLAAPCVIAVRSSAKWDEPDLADAAEEMADLTLEAMAAEAEAEATMANERAREAYWAALAAAARAARLRAEAAFEVAQAAGLEFAEAMRTADAEYVPERRIGFELALPWTKEELQRARAQVQVQQRETGRAA